MKKIFFASLLFVNAATAQKFVTKTGKVSFFSSTPVENIEAVTSTVGAAIDGATNQMAWQLLVKNFQFENELMQEHFNEQYMESEKYPKADFRGKITEPASIDYSKNGVYDVKTTGRLTMHGVARDLVIPGKLTIKDGAVITYSKFSIKTADFNIKIPTLVIKKVAEVIEVTVNATLTQSK